MPWEFDFLYWIQAHLATPFWDGFWASITHFADSGIGWILVAVVLFCIPKTRKVGLTVLMAMAIGGIVCNLTLKPLIARVRPYDVVEGIHLLIPPETDFSFPSGHTLASFAAASAIFAYHKPAGTGALVLAVLIAFSRLYLFVHYPTDVLAGIAFGIGAAIGAYYIVRAIWPKLPFLYRKKKISS